MKPGSIERFRGADGRLKVVADGADASLMEITGWLARGGAKTIRFAWSSPFVTADAEDAPAGVPVQWTCTVEWVHDRRPTIVGRAPELTADHRRGILEAAADVLRQLGANVTILEPVPDMPEGLS